MGKLREENTSGEESSRRCSYSTTLFEHFVFSFYKRGNMKMSSLLCFLWNGQIEKRNLGRFDLNRRSQLITLVTINWNYVAPVRECGLFFGDVECCAPDGGCAAVRATTNCCWYYCWRGLYHSWTWFAPLLNQQLLWSAACQILLLSKRWWWWLVVAEPLLVQPGNPSLRGT